MLTVDVELTGELLFIFRASSSGEEAAGAVPTLVAGLGSRLMTGMATVEVVGNGAVRRLLRMVAVVELEDEERWERAGSGEGFSGSGAGVSSIFWILLKAAFFSSSRSFTVMV